MKKGHTTNKNRKGFYTHGYTNPNEWFYYYYDYPFIINTAGKQFINNVMKQ